MPSHTPAERKKALERGRKRAQLERQRTGLALPKIPPKTVQRGIPPAKKALLEAGTVIKVEPLTIERVIGGQVTRERVRRATEPRRKKKR